MLLAIHVVPVVEHFLIMGGSMFVFPLRSRSVWGEVADGDRILVSNPVPYVRICSTT